MTPQHIAPYVLRSLAQAQMDGRCMDLETLALEIEVRRSDVRKTVSELHRQGLVDALRLRLSLRGFAMGVAMLKKDLGPIRRPAATTEQTTKRVEAA